MPQVCLCGISWSFLLTMYYIAGSHRMLAQNLTVFLSNNVTSALELLYSKFSFVCVYIVGYKFRNQVLGLI